MLTPLELLSFILVPKPDRDPESDEERHHRAHEMLPEAFHQDDEAAVLPAHKIMQEELLD